MLDHICTRMDVANAAFDRARAAYQRHNVDRPTLHRANNRNIIEIQNALIDHGFSSWIDFYAFALLVDWGESGRNARIIDQSDFWFDWPQPVVQ